MDRALGGALELFTARRPRCGSTVRDRGSRWAVAVAMLVAVGLANLAGGSGGPSGLRAVAAGGARGRPGGIALRQWPIRALGLWFTPQVTLQADQVLLTRGPYRVLRHPAYAGAWLAVMGAGRGRDRHRSSGRGGGPGRRAPVGLALPNAGGRSGLVGPVRRGVPGIRPADLAPYSLVVLTQMSRTREIPSRTDDSASWAKEAPRLAGKGPLKKTSPQ
jgi:hypothetical protein